MHKKLSKLLPFGFQNEGSNLRLWGIGGTVLLGFGLLLVRFYQLQVVDHDIYVADLRATTQRCIEKTAQRGEIYDRYGQPLAINQVVSNLYYTSNLKLTQTELNSLLLQLIHLLEINGDTFVDEVPISLEQPFVYIDSQTSLNEFTYQIPYDNEAQRKVLLTYTAEELMDYLQEAFQISYALPKEQVRQLIALRSQIYSCAYRQYEDVLLATNLSDATISYLKENDEKLPNLAVHSDAQRFYPLGNMTSHILGYTRALNFGQYEALKEEGYSLFDVIGQMGVEKSFEETLKGIKGQAIVEVDNMGREVKTISETESVKGKDLYLTIDSHLQEAVYHAVEARLAEALILKLKTPEIYKVTGKDLLLSLIASHNLELHVSNEAMPYSSQLKERLQVAYLQIDPLMRNQIDDETLIAEWLSEEPINQVVCKEILLACQEQGVMQLTDEIIAALQAGENIDLTALFISQLEKGIILPGQMDITPFSAVAAMVDVQTGEVLSLVDYPSYDNNQMVSNFNGYFQKIHEDTRSLLWQRSLKTLKAPGSTFKMVTALAGLEEGCVTQEMIIDDVGVYEEAGKPYPKCWYYTNTGKGHGPLNLQGALGASCNYYFYEVAHRLEEEKEGVITLRKYMEKFGLTEKTGIELEEAEPMPSVPDAIVMHKVSELLETLITSDETARKARIAEEIIDLNKGLLLEYEALSVSEEANQIYTTYLQQYVLPVLQETFEDEYADLLNSIYEDFRAYMQENKEAVEEALCKQILEEEDLTKRYDAAYTAFYDVLAKSISPKVACAIEEVISTIPSECLLDAYEKAALKTYRQLIRSEAQKEEAKVLKETLAAENRQEDGLRKKLLIKVRQNLLNAIVNNLLYGVELNWTEGITVRTAIGQGYNAFSPLQVLRYVAALANGDHLMPLTVVQDGNLGKEKALGLKAEHIKVVQEGMLTVTVGEEGTAKGQFDNLPFKVAAKTGTAEEGSHEHNYIVAFAPYEKPEVALVVAIYNADGLGSYSTLIANDMLSSYFGLQNKQEKITLANTWIE